MANSHASCITSTHHYNIWVFSVLYWLLYHVWNAAELQYVLSKVSDNLHEWQMQAKGNKVFVLVGAIQIVCNEIGMCLYLKK